MPTLIATNIRKAVYGKMAGDTTLNNLLGTPVAPHNKAIYYQIAPDNVLAEPTAMFPYVIFQKQAGTPTYAFANGGSAYDENVWLIKGVDRDTSADGVEAVAQRLDVLLTDATLNISGATLMYLRRESDVAYPEVDSGVRYQHAGALYRLIYQ